MKIRITYDEYFKRYILEGKYMFCWWALDRVGEIAWNDFGFHNTNYFYTIYDAEKHITYLKRKKEDLKKALIQENSKYRFTVIKTLDNPL